MKRYLIIKPDRCVRQIVYADFIDYHSGTVLFYKNTYNDDGTIDKTVSHILAPGAYVSIVEKEETT